MNDIIYAWAWVKTLIVALLSEKCMLKFDICENGPDKKHILTSQQSVSLSFGYQQHKCWLSTWFGLIFWFTCYRRSFKYFKNQQSKSCLWNGRHWKLDLKANVNHTSRQCEWDDFSLHHFLLRPAFFSDKSNVRTLVVFYGFLPVCLVLKLGCQNHIDAAIDFSIPLIFFFWISKKWRCSFDKQSHPCRLSNHPTIQSYRLSSKFRVYPNDVNANNVFFYWKVFL